MCLAIPGRIIEVTDEEHAVVDYGDGTRRMVNISLVDAKVGSYVLVHAGFAIQTIDPREAEETLRLFRELIEAGEE